MATNSNLTPKKNENKNKLDSKKTIGKKEEEKKVELKFEELDE